MSFGPRLKHRLQVPNAASPCHEHEVISNQKQIDYYDNTRIKPEKYHTQSWWFVANPAFPIAVGQVVKVRSTYSKDMEIVTSVKTAHVTFEFDSLNVQEDQQINIMMHG